MGRFISADEIAVITASPTALTDKNLYAYCDNNPVMRGDGDGEFWNLLAGAAIGAAINIIASATIAKLNGEDYTWKNLLVDGITGAVSGALASTGLGALAQGVLNVVISGVGSALSDCLNGEDVNIARFVNAAAMGFASGYIGGAGLRANPAVKSADKTCIKVLHKVQSGAYKTVRGAKSAMTQAINRFHIALKPAVKETTALFVRSSFLSAAGMYAYDYINR